MVGTLEEGHHTMYSHVAARCGTLRLLAVYAARACNHQQKGYIMTEAHFQTQNFAILVDNASGKSLNYRLFNAGTASMLYAVTNVKPIAAPPAGSNSVGVGSSIDVAVPTGMYLNIGGSAVGTFISGWYEFLGVV